jgi:hypothetical protein
VTELALVLAALPSVEWLRRRRSLHAAAAELRRRGAVQRQRALPERERLRRAIAMLDRRLPGGPNCVRRSLLEIRLDAGAARERLFAGFRRGGGPGSGHAWLESDPVTDRYDAVVTV